MKIKCPKCKYEWDTKSKLDFVTCPSCRLKVKNEESPTYMKPINKVLEEK